MVQQQKPLKKQPPAGKPRGFFASGRFSSFMMALRLALLKLVIPFSSLMGGVYPVETKAPKGKEAPAKVRTLMTAAAGTKKKRKSRRKKKRTEHVVSTTTGTPPAATEVSDKAAPAAPSNDQVSNSASTDSAPTDRVVTVSQDAIQPTQAVVRADTEENEALKLEVPVKNASMTSSYGYRIHPISKKRKLHRGVDWAVKKGTPIYAAADGVVVRAHYTPSFGHCVKIRHANGFETTYAHLNGYQRGLVEGKRVVQGAPIGFVGSTGHSTGPHLHFELTKDGKHVNPTTYLV